MLAIWTALGVHLKQAEIDAQLDFFGTILAGEFSNHHLAWLIIPVLEEVRNIKIHVANIMLRHTKSTKGELNLYNCFDGVQTYLTGCGGLFCSAVCGKNDSCHRSFMSAFTSANFPGRCNGI